MVTTAKTKSSTHSIRVRGRKLGKTKNKVEEGWSQLSQGVNELQAFPMLNHRMQVATAGRKIRLALLGYGICAIGGGHWLRAAR